MRDILRFDSQTENGVRSARHVIQIMRSQYLVLGSHPEQLKRLLRRLALEHVQVLYYELIFLSPPDPETLSLFRRLIDIDCLLVDET